MKKIFKSNQQGQVFILSLIVVGLVLANTLIIIGGSQVFNQNTNYMIQTAQAVNLAEAGVDKALASLNASGGSYQGESETPLEGGSFSVAITTANNTKFIESTGYIPSKNNPKVKRTIKASASKGFGMAFNYGVQVGEGGLEMKENAIVNGSVYSNGNITLDNNAKITGDAYVAGGMQATSDQQSDCTLPNCTDFIFGKSVSGNNRLDVAQSFRPSSNNYLGKISLKLKKIGSPSDIAVRILADKNGKPDSDTIITYGTLPANLVTNQYSYIDITFNSTPFLNQNTTYWIMLDTFSNNSNYWSWSADTLSGYTRGVAVWSPDWSERNPSWNNIALDLGFKTYMGGVVTSLQGGNNGSLIGGEAHANTISNITVSKGAYYQIKNNVTAASYFPDSIDPPAKSMPISDANIDAWKELATENGVYSGDITDCRARLESGKYIGNVSISTSCTITVRDPIWITGNLILDNREVFKLDPSYGSSSGIIIVDGAISLSNGVKLNGSGTTGSYIIAISNFDSRVNGQKAIQIKNGGNEGVLYAPLGIVDVENTNQLTELSAWKIELENGVVINYDTGLSSAFFSSGPSGAYSLIKGQYQIK